MASRAQTRPGVVRTAAFAPRRAAASPGGREHGGSPHLWGWPEPWVPGVGVAWEVGVVVDNILSAARENQASKATSNKLSIADKFWELSDVPASRAVD